MTGQFEYVTLGSSDEYTSSGSYTPATTGGYFPIENNTAGSPLKLVPYVPPPVEYLKPWEYRLEVNYFDFPSVDEELKVLEKGLEKPKAVKPVNIRNRKLQF